MCFSDGLNLTLAERDGWDFFFSFLFLLFGRKKKDKKLTHLANVWFGGKISFAFSLFFSPPSLRSRRRTRRPNGEGSSSNQGLSFFFLFSLSLSPRFPIFTERTQTLCWRSCTHQIFYVLARHFTHISCCFYLIFLSGWQNKHALWRLRCT